MIRVAPAPAPSDFDKNVAFPGARLFMELTGDPKAPTRPGPKRQARYARIEDIPVSELEKNSYWTRALPDMRRAYGDTCAYLGMRIHPATGAATIDHFEPKSYAPRRTYDWTNFRLSAKLVNTFKANHTDVLDPFEIHDEWFFLNLLDFKVAPSPQVVDPILHARLCSTIDKRLRLNEPTFCDARRTYHDLYLGLSDIPEPLPLSWLERECPFVARQLRLQGRLRPPDQ